MENNKSLEILEKTVMEMLLRGDSQTLEILRSQWNKSKIERVDFSGAGFFVTYNLPSDIPTLGENVKFSFGDVYTELEGLESPAGYVLFVENGKIKTLECYITDAAFPKSVELKKIYYFGQKERDYESLKKEIEF